MKRLIIRPGAIGDTILSLPAIEHLRPAEIWAPELNLPLLSHVAPASSLVASGIDSLVPGPSTLARLAQFNDIVSWYGAARDDLRQRLSGLPVRFFPALPPADSAEHATDFYLAQVQAPPGAVPRIPVDGGKQEFAVIHPFSGSRKKNWPLERFQEVARLLPFPVRWCAGPDEPLEGAVRFDTLSALIPWLASARLFIGNDSGISHLAGACGLPVVALFGPTDPRVWAPRGHVRAMRFGASPEAVTAAAESLRLSRSFP
ncbi:MAG: glycosyltransferase family 9 protein, partial [Acidobacteria bacterium]|nr:glycosyltransferase family 9 protein [Acidobacteriota bacterium]